MRAPGRTPARSGRLKGEDRLPEDMPRRKTTPDDVTGQDQNPEAVSSRVSSPSPEATEASPTDQDTVPGREDPEVYVGSPEATVRTIPLRDDPRDVTPTAVPEGWSTAPHGDMTLYLCPHNVAHTVEGTHEPCDGCCKEVIVSGAERQGATLADFIKKPTETAESAETTGERSG